MKFKLKMMRITKSRIQTLYLLAALLSLCTLSHGAEEAPPVQIRYCLFDPLRGNHELFLMNAKTDALVPVMLADRSLSREAIPVKRFQGRVHFLRNDKLEKEELFKPDNVAFSVAVPDSVTQAAIVIIASGDRLYPVLLDDSPGIFPFGHSRLINTTTVAVGVRAGEHKIAALPGKIVPIPPVRQLNEYQQAKVSFECQMGESEPVVLSRKPLPFNDNKRRIWIAYVTKGAKRPVIATIVDSWSPPPPEHSTSNKKSAVRSAE